MISQTFSIALAAAALWAIGFSMFNSPSIRGYRNLGILACYVIGLVMLSSVSWSVAGCTWLVFGLAGGLAYVGYDIMSVVTARKDQLDGDEEPPRVRLSHLPFGLLAWPIMLPEAIEYTLAELGLLTSSEPEESATQQDEHAGEQ